MSSTFAVSMDCPSATIPEVCLHLRLSDVSDRPTGDAYRAVWGDDGQGMIRIWVPMFDTWTPDTLRMVFAELAAHLPPDEAAQVGVTLEWTNPRRTAKTPNPIQRLKLATPWVQARGWRATLITGWNLRQKWLNNQWVPGCFPTGEWSPPMIDVLVALEGKGAIPLGAIGRVLPADPARHNLKFPSRARGERWGRQVAAETGGAQ